MITFLINALKVIFLLGFLILIHECGHFFAAKLCKVKVKEFAIGFGPTIWKKQGKETKYALRLIPLGGFVNMLGEEERSNEEGSFSQASILKRSFILLAGGTVNILFGIIVYFILAASSGTYISTTVDSLMAGYNAEVAGIQVGDEIVKIDGKKIRLRSDIDNIVSNSNGEELVITIKRNDEIKEFKVTPTKKETKSIGIYLGAEGEDPGAEIKSVIQNAPAKEAGIEEGDIITAINGEKVEGDSSKAVDLISNSTTEEIQIEVARGEENLIFDVVPEVAEKYYIGVAFKKADKTFVNSIYYGFWDTIDFSVSIIDNLKLLFTGNVSTDQLTGPVGIADVVSKTQGIIEFICMLALISLSLGVTNLLPFPPLDGGKIVLLIIEGVRRKPLKENFEIGLQMAGFILLIALSIYVTYNDILRIF